MKMTVVRPSVKKFQLRFERDDPLYHRCMWADIILDFDSYSIMAQTDCGDYSHRWPAAGKETFRDLCLRVLGDDEYLLGKFSSQSRFSLSQSKELALVYHGNDARTRKEIESVQAVDDHEWVEELLEIGISEPWEYIVRDYPAGARVFVRILREYILPELRKEPDHA